MPPEIMNPDDAAWVLKYKGLFSKIQRTIIDMPDRRLNDLLASINKNNGRLARETYEQCFAEVTSDEVAAIEAAYAEVFGAKVS
jgi:hypothetical protein